MYIVVMSVSLLLSHTEKKQKNYFASSDPHQWEEGGHGILEGSWGFGCRGIGGWGEEEEEDEERRGHGILEGSWGLGCWGIGGWGGGGKRRKRRKRGGPWDSSGFLWIRLSEYRC